MMESVVASNTPAKNQSLLAQPSQAADNGEPFGKHPGQGEGSAEENPGTPVSAEYGRGDKRRCESSAPPLRVAKGSVPCCLA